MGVSSKKKCPRQRNVILVVSKIYLETLWTLVTHSYLTQHVFSTPDFRCGLLMFSFLSLKTSTQTRGAVISSFSSLDSLTWARNIFQAPDCGRFLLLSLYKIPLNIFQVPDCNRFLGEQWVSVPLSWGSWMGPCTVWKEPWTSGFGYFTSYQVSAVGKELAHLRRFELATGRGVSRVSSSDVSGQI